MKIVCICVGGQVRSPALANILISKYGINAVPVSGANPFPGNFNWYINWADKIIIIGNDALDVVRNKITGKFYEFIDIFDIFGSSDNPDLLQKLSNWCEQNKNILI